jgi:two-component system, NtrC family, sensor histidine kinase HydH
LRAAGDRAEHRIRRRDLFIVVGLFLAGMIGVAWFARYSVKRDREHLVDRFSRERGELLQAAALEVEADFKRLADDLKLAGRLVDTSDSVADSERELRALVAVVPAYQAVEIRDGSGQVLLSVDSSGGARPTAALRQAIAAASRDAARRKPGVIVVSGRIDGESLWMRAAAMSDPGGIGSDRVVAFVVDTQPFFAKLNLLAREPGTRLLVLGPSGAPALTDSRLSEAVTRLDRGDDIGEELAEMIRRLRMAERGRWWLSAAAAGSVGMDDAAQAVTSAPIDGGPGARWVVAMFSSTGSLRSHESMIIRRAVSVGALAAGLLLAMAVYLIVVVRRAAILRGRLLAADRLAHVNEKADKILESIPTMVLALSDRRQVTACNRALRLRTGDIGVGCDLDEVFGDAAPEAIREITELLDRAVRDSAIQSRLGVALTLFGEPGQYNLHAVPLERRVPDAEALLVIDDLSELHQLEEHLVRSEKLATVGVLAAGIAHEIGTPLGIARGRAEYMLSRPGSDAVQRDGLGVIVSQVDHVSRTISQLLDFSRQRAPRRGRVSIPDAVAATVELLRFELERRQVSVECALPSDLPPLLADADLVQQVLVNLVLNACDACEPGGRVRVGAAHEVVDGLTWMCLVVEDDGCGIRPEHRHRIFDPFFTTKKRGHGTGLGLSIVARIVRDHGGRIDIESVVGEGTRVLVRWPCPLEVVREDRVAG